MSGIKMSGINTWVKFEPSNVCLMDFRLLLTSVLDRTGASLYGESVGEPMVIHCPDHDTFYKVAEFFRDAGAPFVVVFEHNPTGLFVGFN